MHGQYCCDGLHLDNNDVLDDQVDTVALVKIDAFVDQWYRPLCHAAKIPGVQLVQQAWRIRGFEKTRPEGPMDFDGCGQNVVSDRVEFSLNQHAHVMSKPRAHGEMS